jgi:hypothetical protein
MGMKGGLMVQLVLDVILDPPPTRGGIKIPDRIRIGGRGGGRRGGDAPRALRRLPRKKDR